MAVKSQQYFCVIYGRMSYRKLRDECLSIVLVFLKMQNLGLGLITLRTSCSTVYCNWSWLFVGGCVCVCGLVCYHDNSKLRASILTKLDF